MIVCSCNAVSDRDVRGFLTTTKARPSVGTVFRNLGCAVQCGRCARNIVDILDRHVCQAGDSDSDCAMCDGGQTGGLAA
jgi:bacterioferritin-associated ferredoxin